MTTKPSVSSSASTGLTFFFLMKYLKGWRWTLTQRMNDLVVLWLQLQHQLQLWLFYNLTQHLQNRSAHKF